MKRLWLWAGVGLLLAAGLALWRMDWEYAYIPPAARVESVPGNGPLQAAAAGLPGGEDPAMLALGREAFYGETFGNEIFLTDVLGMLDGPVTLRSFTRALAELRGRGTSNLRVALERDATIGGRTFRAGEMIDTGLDVPRGAWTPLGMPVRVAGARVRVGISCAACHATVARDTLKVVEGAPNLDLNNGLLLALSANSTALFTHAEPGAMDQFVREPQRTVPTSDGRSAALPDPDLMEEAVERTFLSWPPGFFDSTIDLTANPTKIPHAFTRGNHPYGWSGFAMAGPMHGLSTFASNVHAQSTDALARAEAAPALFDMDRELYLGTILQRSPAERFRYDPATGQMPSAFFAAVDPTPGVDGINELVRPPTWPKVTLVAPDGLLASSPGHRVWEQNNAMAAWQNRLRPPRTDGADPQRVAQGRAVFERAGCLSCHAGVAGTNNRVIPAPVVGTQPSRAAAFKKTEKIFAPPALWSFDTPVPVPPDAKPLPVPTEGLDPEQVKLAWAHGDSPGGYKVPGLMGLIWTAPYLHDGGVAVGADAATQIGVPGTLLKGIPVDPRQSLRALLDRDLRERVLAANRADPSLRAVRVEGVGHTFWVDSPAGFAADDREALIDYLLSIAGPAVE